MNSLLKISKKYLISFSLTMLAAGMAYAVPDWKEDGSTLGCVYAKTAPGKGLKNLPIAIYSQPNDAQPKLVIDNQKGFVAFLAVSKKGNWVKLKGAANSEPYFRDGQHAGYAKASELEWGALRNCN